MPLSSRLESFPVGRVHGDAVGPGRMMRLVVLVPAYNPGTLLEGTLKSILRYHPDVWLLVDGSTDASDERLDAVFGGSTGFRVIRHIRNRGKGAVLLDGAQMAKKEKFTHVLCFDADGQHPADRIPEFRAASESHPEALVMGEPCFGRDAPFEREYCRRVANVCARLATGGRMRWDSLFGMRVYPVGALLDAFQQTRRGRGYDFETEIAVRMIWNNMAVIGIRTPVTYPHPAEGGVSHFRYVRDNLLLAGTHFRLLSEALRRFVRDSVQKKLE